MNLKMRLNLMPALSIILIATLAVVSGGCGGAKTLQESVIVRDTVIVTKERKLVDTLILKELDTITIVKDNVRIRLQRVNDTIYVNAECPTDTFYVPMVTVNQDQQEKDDGHHLEFYVGWLLAILFALYIVRRLLDSFLPK